MSTSSSGAAGAPLSLDQLKAEVADGRIDTVIVGITDMQGRLQGKRVHAPYFVEHVLPHGTEGCNYLLAVDVDMNTVDGYAMSSWDSGYGDMVMRPDLSTLHRNPWQPGTVGVLCDLETEEGDPVAPSPRQILRKQLDRLHEAGYGAFVGTELEFIVFQDSYEEAWLSGYRDLTPANLSNVDYSMLGTARVEPLLRRIRLAMAGAGMVVESPSQDRLVEASNLVETDTIVGLRTHHNFPLRLWTSRRWRPNPAQTPEKTLRSPLSAYLRQSSVESSAAANSTMAVRFA